MILTVKNKDEFVIAYIVFQVVDEESRMCKDGKYLFINGFWIHPDFRWNTRNILQGFIHELFRHPETQCMEFVYWERENGKVSTYLAWRFVKKLTSGKLLRGDDNGKDEYNDYAGNNCKSYAGRTRVK